MVITDITDIELDHVSKESCGRFLASLPPVRQTSRQTTLASLVEREVQEARARVRAHLSAQRAAW